MRSTDTNLNNPTSTDTLEVLKEFDAWKYPKLLTCTQDFYDLLQTKDPHVIYYIEGSYPARLYYGESLITAEKTKVSYVMGPADSFNEYSVYMWRRDPDRDMLIEICKYNNPQAALDAINKFGKCGSHDKINSDIYDILNSYIDEEISIHDMIVSIIAVFGFRDDPRLQELTGRFVEYGFTSKRSPFRDIPALAREMIAIRAQDKDSLFGYYEGVYNIVLKNNFFRGDKYSRYTDMRDLSKEVNDVCNVFIASNPFRNLYA